MSWVKRVAVLVAVSVLVSVVVRLTVRGTFKAMDAVEASRVMPPPPQSSLAPRPSAPVAVVPADPVVSGLNAVSAVLNLELPRMVDDVTRLDATSVGPGRTLSFSYTVLDHRFAGMNRQDLRDRLLVQVTALHCADADAVELLKAGATLGFHYIVQNSGPLASFTMDRTMCGL